jgi:hypothetical protein
MKKSTARQTKQIKVPNETSEEAARREAATEAGRELIEEQEAQQTDDEVILARLDESEEDRNKRRMQHTADERAQNDVGRVREIADTLSRDEAAYQNRLDNAARRLRGLAGSNVPIVAEAVRAVGERYGLKVTPEGLRQPKPAYKPGHSRYPFEDA